MKTMRVWAVGAMLAGICAGCASKGEVRRARADRDRMAIELAETRTTRDQYAVVVEKTQQAVRDAEEQRQKALEDARRARDELAKARGELATLQRAAEAAKAEMDQVKLRLQNDVKAALDRAASAEQRAKDVTIQRDELAKTVSQLKKSGTPQKTIQ